MFRRLDYYLAGLLCILLIASEPARAESLGWKQIEQVQRTKMNGRDGRRGPELRLAKNMAKNDARSEAGKEKISKNTPRTQSTAKNNDSLLPKSDAVSQGGCSGTNVEQVDLCDVTGTVCEDCGEVVLVSEVLPEFAEIPHAGAGFPNIPLYALAAIPIAFLPFLRRTNKSIPPQVLQPNTPETNITITQTLPPPGAPETPPTTPTTPVPEPASMLLLGSGLAALGAAARRRRRRNQDDPDARVESFGINSSSEVL